MTRTDEILTRLADLQRQICAAELRLLEIAGADRATRERDESPAQNKFLELIREREALYVELGAIVAEHVIVGVQNAWNREQGELRARREAGVTS